MSRSKVRFIHVLLASLTMVGMAIVAATLGHTTVEGAVQDILTVAGTLALTVLYTTFRRN